MGLRLANLTSFPNSGSAVLIGSQIYTKSRNLSRSGPVWQIYTCFLGEEPWAQVCEVSYTPRILRILFIQAHALGADGSGVVLEHAQEQNESS